MRKKDRLKEIKNGLDVMSTIVDNLPDLDNLGANFGMYPLDFLFDLLKQTKGYNVVLSILAKFVVDKMPDLEVKLKGELIRALREMLNCSINPFFSEQVLRDGILLNLDEVDVSGVLRHSPLDRKVGSHFYMFTEGFEIPDDVFSAKDMNAFIWGVVNRAASAKVWKPKGAKKGQNETTYDKEDPKAKRSLNDGILTMEYHANPTNVKNIYDEKIVSQIPTCNTLHVQIGDSRRFAKGLQRIKEEGEARLNELDIKEVNRSIMEIDKNKFDQRDGRNGLETQLTKGVIGGAEFKKSQANLAKELNDVNDRLNHLDALKKGHVNEKRKFDLKLGMPIIDSLMKGNIERNYYSDKSLLDFNIDYINSLTMFDPRNILASVMEAISGSFSIGVNLSFKQALVKHETQKMVEKLIRSEDVVISDCFFTFSNAEYNDFSAMTELRKAGVLSVDGSYNGTNNIDINEFSDSLNSISSAASKQEQQTIIEGMFEKLAKNSTTTNEEWEVGVNNNPVQISVLRGLVDKLAYAVVSSIISPQIYILLMINLKVLGKEKGYTLEDFLSIFRQILLGLIKYCIDYLVGYLVDILLKEIYSLSLDVKYKTYKEQIEYYLRLILRCWDKLKRYGKNYGVSFTTDKVDYADIDSYINDIKLDKC